MDIDQEKTMIFDTTTIKENSIRETLREVYEALKEKGYDPINQIAGYILSEDPTYITSYKNARARICKLDRDELLNTLVKDYIGL